MSQERRGTTRGARAGLARCIPFVPLPWTGSKRGVRAGSWQRPPRLSPWKRGSHVISAGNHGRASANGGCMAGSASLPEETAAATAIAATATANAATATTAATATVVQGSRPHRPSPPVHRHPPGVRRPHRELQWHACVPFPALPTQAASACPRGGLLRPRLLRPQPVPARKAMAGAPQPPPQGPPQPPRLQPSLTDPEHVAQPADSRDGISGQ